MVNTVGSSTQSRTSGLKIPSMKASAGVIHLEMGGDYESPTNSSKNTKDEATSNYLSNILEKPRKMKWKEVDVPVRLKELKSFKEGDWKVLVNKRENGRTDWKYIHQRYHKTFLSAPGVRFFLDGKEMNQVFKGQKLQKKKKNDPSGQASGASKPSRGRKAADTRTRALTLGKPFHYVPEKLPVGFI